MDKVERKTIRLQKNRGFNRAQRSTDSKETMELKNLEAQIIVIGGGGTGLAAALAASERGAKVILLEKRGVPGGNTALARGIFAAESPVQKRMKIDALRDKLFETAMSYSHWKIDPKIVRAFVDKSGDTIGWLEKHGMQFEDILHYYPNQVPRVFHVPKGRGAGLVKLLVKRCQEMGVKMFFHTGAKKILTNEKGKIAGVLAASKEKEFRINAKNVIIGTGGYGGNRDLLKKYYPGYTEDLCLHGLPNMGDGLMMAMELGAATEGLGILHLRGPRFAGSSYISVIAEEPNTIWVNNKCERYIGEATAFYWPESGNALNRQPDKISYTLFDEKIKQSFLEDGLIKGVARFPVGTKMLKLEKELQHHLAKGAVKISDSWTEIAKWIGALPKVLKSTVSDYNSYCDQGYDKMFMKDRKFLQPLRTPPYYALKCVQSFHGTIGGIKIDHRMQVLDQKGKPIPGLYGGGIDTGGWESDTYCITLSGSAFGFALNSGRIAGENASANSS
jgi:fumarate reductase flavoprotein subunit